MDPKINPNDKAKRLREQAVRLDDDGESAESASKTLAAARAALIEEAEATQKHYSAKVTELDTMIADYKRRAVEAKATADELRRIADEIEK
jgi:hypothetical protein